MYVVTYKLRESESTLSPKSMLLSLNWIRYCFRNVNSQKIKTRIIDNVLAHIIASMKISFDITCSFRSRFGPFHAFQAALARLYKRTDEKHSCIEKQKYPEDKQYATLIRKWWKVVMWNYPYCQVIIRLQYSCHHAMTRVSCLELNS